ncbi:MAG TPA: aminotransferase class V-fold PLP-dependent enzyme [Candidatus Angelobacter sp.]|nr:aminotransferase class V-fold PLP-dependent enzyme [Candidatus Angelobacter sp.]
MIAAAAPPPPAETTVPYGRTLRRLFRLDEAATFLNHGSFGLTPLTVLAAQEAFRTEMERQPVQFLSRVTLQPRLRAAAGQLAAFLGAAADDLVFVDNATTGVNAVLRSLVLRAGDEVLINDHTYPAVRNAVRFVCARAGASIVEAKLPFPAESPDAIVAAVTAALTDRTRLAIFDLVSSASAIIMPAAALARVCRDAGVRVLIDAAHGPGMLDLDLPGLQADWVSGNAHKWLFAPKGCALLWAAKEAQQELHPTVISHGFEQGFTNEFDWTGTRDPTAWLALPAALDFYRSMGNGALRARNHALAVAAGEMLAKRWGTMTGAPAAMAGAMAVVRLPGRSPATLPAAQAVHDRLWQKYHIEVPVMSIGQALWVRVSAQIYNDLEDYEKLAAALAEP